MTTLKTMRWIMYLAGGAGITVAVVLVGIGLIFGRWDQALFAFVWLLLMSANFHEYMTNQNRRDGYHAKEMATMKRDQITWAEQVILSKSLLASRFAHRVSALGLDRDEGSLAAAGNLFAEIAMIELPDGVAENIVKLHAQAAEAAEACRTGQMPSERVLH